MGLVVLVQLSDIESGGSVFEGFAVFGKRGTIEFKKGFGLRWTLNAFVWKRRRCCLQAEGERERELLVAEWISGLSTGSRRFFIFFLPWSDIFALYYFTYSFFFIQLFYFILLKSF
jgi:hypothetical protein